MAINKNKVKDTQSKNYMGTINNPDKYHITFETIKETLLLFKPKYFIISKEQGLKSKLIHFHFYISCNSPVRFSTMVHRFPTAHLETALGSANDNRDYIMKQNKWADSVKSETLIDWTEWGEIPLSAKEKKQSEKAKLLQDIKDGKTNLEIIEENENMIFRLKDIETIRQSYLIEKYSTEFRDIDTTFIFGKSATYKTSHVYSKFNAKDIFRIYNYQNLNSLWDGYSGQSVVLFDEFTGQIPIELMLVLTDKFPILNLSARYNNKIAMFSHIYFCSNTNFSDVYSYEKNMRSDTYQAWLRRIQNIYEFQKELDGSLKIIKHKETKKEEF